MIVVDTGPLYAAADSSDAHHAGTYADMPLGAVDASVVAVAERLGATTILTLDRRHFSVSGRGTSGRSRCCRNGRVARDQA